MCIFCDEVALVRASADNPFADVTVTVGVCEDHYTDDRTDRCAVCNGAVAHEIDVDDGDAPLELCRIHCDPVSAELKAAWERGEPA
jgi:hypothetical protein